MDVKLKMGLEVQRLGRASARPCGHRPIQQAISASLSCEDHNNIHRQLDQHYPICRQNQRNRSLDERHSDCAAIRANMRYYCLVPRLPRLY